MPAKLEWQIVDKDHDLPDESSLDKKPRAACLSWLRFFVVVALVLVVGLGVFWRQLRRERQKVERQLRQTVQLELDNLLQGDLELFLNAQEPNNQRWRKAQIELFESYKSWLELDAHPQAGGFWLGDLVGYTGQVAQVHVSGKQAWAEVEIHCEAQGGGACWQIWLYRWIDGLWYHVPLDDEWLGQEQELLTGHLRFVYPQRDAQVVETLAVEMEAWYVQLAALYGVAPGDELLMTVEFAHRPAGSVTKQFRWDARQPHLLRVPTPQQLVWAQDGTLGGNARRTLANFMAEALLAQADWLDTPLRDSFPVEMWALHQELRDWGVKSLGLPPSPLAFETPLLQALLAQYGKTVVPTLAAGLSQSVTLSQTLDAAGLTLSDPTREFAFLLEAERRLLVFRDWDYSNVLLDPLADPDWRSFMLSFSTFQNQIAWAYGPNSLITSVVFQDDVAWVETQQTWRSVQTTNILPQIVESGWSQTRFFRRAGGRWLFTSPDPTYFGAFREETSKNLILRYFERDADWYAGLTAELQPLFEQIAVDLEVNTADQIFTFEETFDVYSGSDLTFITFPSPRVNYWTDASSQVVLPGLTYRLIAVLSSEYTKDADVGNRVPNMFARSAIVRWELARLFPEHKEGTFWFSLDQPEGIAEQTLDDLWSNSPHFKTQSEYNLIWTGYYTLIEYLAEAYGPQVVPELLRNWDELENLDDWLRLSTGDGLEQIEPAWQAWVLDNYP